MVLLNFYIDREVLGESFKDDYNLKMYSLEGSFQWFWFLVQVQVNYLKCFYGVCLVWYSVSCYVQRIGGSFKNFLGKKGVLKF